MGIVQKDSMKITVLSFVGAGIGVMNKMLFFPMWLTTEQVGLANLLASVGVLYASLSLLGSHNVMLRYFPRFRDKENAHNGLLWWLTLVVTAGFLFFTALLFVFRTPLTDYYSKNSPLLVHYFYYLVPFGAVTLYFFFFDGYLRALYKTVVPVLFYEVFLRIFIAASVGGYALKLYSFEQFVFIYLIAHCLPTLIILIYTAWLGQLFLKPQPLNATAEIKAEMRSFGTFSFFNQACSVLLVTLDGLLVAGMLGLEETGIYTTMFFFVSMLTIPYRSMVKIAGPVVADNWERKDMTAMAKLYQQVTAANLVIGAVFFTLVWINMDVAFAFMPAEYEAGRFAFFFLALGRLFDMFSGINGLILVTSEWYKWDLLFSLVLILLLGVLSPLFITLWGMQGAAIGASVSIVIYNSLRIWFLHNKYGMQPFSIQPLLILFIGAGLIALNEWALPEMELIAGTIVKTLGAGIIFTAAVYILRPAEEINVLLGRIRKKVTGK